MTTQVATLKRVKRQIKTSQNPLFEKWLKEWKDEAASKGSEMQYVFNKALKSLQKFPIKLYSGKECLMLENFGAKLCQKLDGKLEAYKASHPEDLSVYPRIEKDAHISITSVVSEVSKITKKRRSTEASPIKKKKIDVRTNLNKESKTKGSSYIPAFRSGGYAILIAMFEKLQEDNYKGYMTKTEIESYAQEFCDTSFTKPLPGSYYTAWSSMAVLIRKKFVSKEGKPARFSLTEEGIDLAIKLRQLNEEFGKAKENDLDSVSPIKSNLQTAVSTISPIKENKVKSSPFKKNKNFSSQEKLLEVSPIKDIQLQTASEPTSPITRNGVKASPYKKNKNGLSQEDEPASETDETVFLLPGSFEIVLLVDTQERDDKSQQAAGMTMNQLKSRNVNFEIRHLKVGDFIWIARDLRNGFELVLPYIVERKRLDDLSSSIKDGRFHEQKFRLKQSGIENLIYLVEKYGNENQRLGLPLPTLMQAVSNTQVLDEFTVRITNNYDHSMRYLDCLTTQLSNLFKTKTLMSCKKSNLSPANLSDDLISLMTFKDFNKGSEKNKVGNESKAKAKQAQVCKFKANVKKPTVKNMLAKHLLQLNGVSLEKAQTIVQLYPTPKALMEALKQSSGEKSIADATYGNFNRSIGPVTAKQIKMLYTSLELR